MESPTHVSQLTDHIGYWMRLVSNDVSHEFARKLENKNVTVAEWVILREMFNGDKVMNPSHVVELTGLTKGAVSKLIERLLQKKLVIRKESSSDRRFQDIALTPKARNLTPQLALLADQNENEFFSNLSHKEKEQLMQLLKKIAHSNGLKISPIK